jgi:hypothetical protein
MQLAKTAAARFRWSDCCNAQCWVVTTGVVMRKSHKNRVKELRRIPRSTQGASYGATRVLDRVSPDVERGEMIPRPGSPAVARRRCCARRLIRPEVSAIPVDGKVNAVTAERNTAMKLQSYAQGSFKVGRRQHGYDLRAVGKKPRSQRAWPMLKPFSRQFRPAPGTQPPAAGGGRARARRRGSHAAATDEPMSN